MRVLPSRTGFAWDEINKSRTVTSIMVLLRLGVTIPWDYSDVSDALLIVPAFYIQLERNLSDS